MNQKTYWSIQIDSLDLRDSLRDEYWKMRSALQFELSHKNKFDTEEKAKQVFDTLPKYLKDESSVVEFGIKGVV